MPKPNKHQSKNNGAASAEPTVKDATETAVKDATQPAATPGASDPLKIGGPVTDSAGGPTEASKEEELEKRAAALAETEKDYEKLVTKLAKDWAKADKEAKDWMLTCGQRCYESLKLATDGGIDEKDAIAKLRSRLLLYTGEDKTADIPRHIQVYFASQVFGPNFGKLPIRAQKEFGSCFDREEGKWSFTLRAKIGDSVKRVYAIAVGESQSPDWWSKEAFTKNRDGIMIGSDVASYIKAIKDEKDPFRKPEEKKEEGTPAGGDAGKDGKDGKDTNDATNKRPDKTADGAEIKRVEVLDEKPAIAAASLASMLTKHDDTPAILHHLGKVPEINTDLVAALVQGMLDAGRLDEVKVLTRLIIKETKVAEEMIRSKCSREEALRKVA